MLSFPPPFGSLFAWSVAFETADRGGQGDTEGSIAAGIDMLANFPTVRGGITLDVTYRPLDDSGLTYVSDEAWDFSAQTMSLIGNNFSANPQSLRWDDGGGDGGKGTPITNITAIVKVIPKVEFVQTLVYQQSPPEQFQAALIGSVNAGPLFAGGSTGISTSQWATGAVLLSGLPVVRRWRFDGQNWFQWGCKLSINCYQDVIEDGSTDFVTWNRLYRPDFPGGGRWFPVLVGDSRARSIRRLT